jgi:hypothetical protein
MTASLNAVGDQERGQGERTAATIRLTTWSCGTRIIIVRNTAVEGKRIKRRSARDECEGLSCVRGNLHAQF